MPELADDLAHAVGRREGVDPALGEARDAPQNGICLAGHEQRQRILPRFWEAVDVPEIDEPAAEARLLLGPQGLQRLDEFVHHLTAVDGAELASQPAIILARPAETDADRQPSARQHIERCGLPVQQDRVMQGQHDDAGEEADPPGLRRQIAEGRQRVVIVRRIVEAGPDVRIGLQELVQPERVVAELFRRLCDVGHPGGIDRPDRIEPPLPAIRHAGAELHCCCLLLPSSWAAAARQMTMRLSPSSVHTR